MNLLSIKLLAATAFACIVSAQVEAKGSRQETQNGNALAMASRKRELRAMSQEKKPHRVKFTSKSVEQGQKNAFRVEFSTKGFPNVRTKFMSGGDGTEHSVSSFRTGILCVSEYNDTISPAESKNIVHLVGKKNVDWSTIQVDENYNGTNATRAMTIGTGKDQFSNFNITIEVFSSPGDALLSQKHIQPNDTKISLTIKGFPYEYDHGKVAIHFAIWSKANRQVNGTHVVTNGNVFTWDDTVIADGNVTSITKLNSASLMPTEDEEDDQAESSESHDFVTFGINAEHAASIYWDPEMIQGDTPESVSPNSGVSLHGTTIFGLVICILNAFL